MKTSTNTTTDSKIISLRVSRALYLSYQEKAAAKNQKLSSFCRDVLERAGSQASERERPAANVLDEIAVSLKTCQNNLATVTAEQLTILSFLEHLVLVQEQFKQMLDEYFARKSEDDSVALNNQGLGSLTDELSAIEDETADETANKLSRKLNEELLTDEGQQLQTFRKESFSPVANFEKCARDLSEPEPRIQLKEDEFEPMPTKFVDTSRW